MRWRAIEYRCQRRGLFSLFRCHGVRCTYPPAHYFRLVHRSDRDPALLQLSFKTASFRALSDAESCADVGISSTLSVEKMGGAGTDPSTVPHRSRVWKRTQDVAAPIGGRAFGSSAEGGLLFLPGFDDVGDLFAVHKSSGQKNTQHGWDAQRAQEPGR